MNFEKNYELAKQLDRSLGSVMDNADEGFERGGNKEFIQFLSIGKSSAAEARSQLYRTLDRELISQAEFDRFYADCLLIGEKIGKFITYLRNSEMKGYKYYNKPTQINNK